MNNPRQICADVQLLAFVKDGGGITPATLLVPGAVPLIGLTAAAMKAVASQHPHLGGKPIVALRYAVEAKR